MKLLAGVLSAVPLPFDEPYHVERSHLSSLRKANISLQSDSELPSSCRGLLVGQLVFRDPGSRVRDAGDPADPDTHMVGGDNLPARSTSPLGLRPSFSPSVSGGRFKRRPGKRYVDTSVQIDIFLLPPFRACRCIPCRKLPSCRGSAGRSCHRSRRSADSSP